MIHKNRNISLDFFRGIMALLVSLGHFYWWNNESNTIPFSFILAVDFFLVLSGFVLAASILGKENFDSFSFAKKRYLRLAPVYFFCAIVTVPLFFLWDKLPIPNLADIIKSITISQMIPFNDRSPLSIMNLNPLGISYTISAELWVGIILFPLIFFLNKSAEPLTLPTLLILIITCLLKINFDSPDFMSIHYGMAYTYVPWGIIRCVMDYSIGIASYIIISKSSDVPRKYVASILQIICVLTYAYLYARMNYARQNELFAPFLFAIFIGSLYKSNGAIYRLTKNKFGKFLGDISYPLYLIHPLFIFILIRVVRLEVNSITATLYILASITLSLIHI